MKMAGINVKEKYHADILKVWNMGKSISDPAFKEIYRRGAFVQDTLNQDTILFLGIGASWNDEKKNSVDEVDAVQYETEKGRTSYPYYKPMIKLAEDTRFTSWSHIDMTLLRETRQKNATALYKIAPDFMQAQFDLAVKMISDIKPKVIIASNAFVRSLLKDKTQAGVKSGLEFIFDGELGTDTITAPAHLKNTPAFFTSMLSGIRPRFSRKIKLAYRLCP
jgi:hypothetical protein